MNKAHCTDDYATDHWQYSLLNAKKPCASAGSVQSTRLQISIAYQMHNCALLNVMHKILCLK